MDTSSQLAGVNQLFQEFLAYAEQKPLAVTAGAVLLAWMFLGSRR
ncbi:MAG: hypothetical protein M0T85_01720 [Dehalococcoidales bacterium]|nr:hypothetical protein [Dehalococcoidales bacterium]